MSFKRVLIHSRIHTASLTIPVAMIGYILSGRVDVLSLTLIAVIALLFHGVGFSWNNIFDYSYDRMDKNKTHFPIISGDIDYKRTVNATIIATVITLLIAIITDGNIISDAMFIVAIVFGFIYNIYNKRTLIATVYISLSFASIPVYAYFFRWSDLLHIIGNAPINYTPLIPTFMFIFSFLTMMFQISVSGYLKDMEVPQKNLLIWMGGRVQDNVLHSSPLMIAYSIITRLLPVVSVLVFIPLLHFNLIFVILFLVLEGVTVYLTIMMLQSVTYDRKRELKRMSMIEIINYFSYVFITASLVTRHIMLQYITFMILFPVIWFIVMNRIMWGTDLYPNV